MLTILTITVVSANRHPEEVMAWVRAHQIDPTITFLVKVFPWCGLALFGCYEKAAHGRLYLRTCLGDEHVAWRWHLRRLRLPPASEWCEGASC